MAYSDAQLRGVLLEEAVIYLLYASGYEPVLTPGSDPTLSMSASGMEVQGRGEKHQIDAIADFVLSPPFGNPQRLLVEAKFLSKRVGIPIVRNAVGISKDVSEYWVGTPKAPGSGIKKRYHYLYSIFSASDFTRPAQNYAFAHDIHLLPIRNSSYLLTVINAIEAVGVREIRALPALLTVRQYVRNQLFNAPINGPADEVPEEMRRRLDEFVEEVSELRYGFVTMFGNLMPVFLIARRGLQFQNLANQVFVRIRWIDGSWFIEDDGGEELFSFDLPDDLYRMYASRGILDRRAVANIKNDWMRQFNVFFRTDEGLGVKNFRLDDEWFAAIQRAKDIG